MRRLFAFAIMFLFLNVASGMVSVDAGEKAPRKIVEYAQAKLVKLGADPVIVKAVKAENAKEVLDQIKEMDKNGWQRPA